jgi:hypothetical protein
MRAQGADVDFATLIPALVSWGPPGVVIGILLWMLTGRDAIIKEQAEQLRTQGEARLNDAKTTLEARVVAEREFQRVVSESTAATVRVTAALESVTDTLREVAEAARVEREIARREAGRGTAA